MTFDDLTYVWIFVFVPLLILFFVFYEKARLAILKKFGWTKKDGGVLFPGLQVWGERYQFILAVLFVLFIGLALLKPYSTYSEREIKQSGLDLYVLLDLSTSMWAQDIKPSRIARAKFEIKDLMKKAKGDRIGLIGFAGEAFVFVPLTSDTAALNLFLDDLEPGKIPIPGTDIQGAIQKAVQSFKGQAQNSNKAVVLITDGENSVNLSESWIKELNNNQVHVFVFGMGTKDGGPIPIGGGAFKKDLDGKIVISKLNVDALKNLALETGGAFVQSTSDERDLSQLYDQGIKKVVEETERDAKKKKLPDYEFSIFLWLAFLCLMLSFLCTSKKKFWLSLFLRKQAVFFLVLFIPLSANAFWSPDKQAKQDFNQESYEGAAEEYESLHSKDPDNLEWTYNLGNSHYKNKKYDQAIQAFEKSLNAKDSKIRVSSAYNLGNSYFQKKDYEKAIEAYELALKMDPEHENAKYNLEIAKKMLSDEQEQEQKDQEKKEDDKKQDKQNQQDQQENKEDESSSDESSADKGSEGKEDQNKDSSGNEEQNQKDQKGTQDEQDQKQNQPSGNDEQNQEESKETQQENQETKGEDNKENQSSSAKASADKSSSEEDMSPTKPSPKKEDSSAEALAKEEVYQVHPADVLEQIQDNPSQVIEGMIQNQMRQKRPQKFEQDW